MHLRLDDEAAGAKVNVLLVLALRRGLSLVLCELAAQSTGLLGTQVQGLELLALVELTQVSTLLEVDHRQDTGNVLANRVAVTLVPCYDTYMRASLLDAPPATFWTRSWSSSLRSSSTWFSRSVLDLFWSS